MAEPDFSDRNAYMGAHYSALVRQYGDSPKAAQWRGSRSQEKRIDILFGIADLSTAKILDFGCGTGHLHAMLKRRFDFTGEYVGYDISDGMLALARRKFPSVRFEKTDIFGPVAETFDYVLASGPFNNEHRDAADFFVRAIPRLFALCRRGMAFNALSAYAPHHTVQLLYLDPLQVFDWVKREITPLVTLRHDYRIEDEQVPEDFTLYLRRDEPATA